ncbi:MAG: SDR family NAD(P)-dependent oxidoreductase [Micrococcales bacterium]|nr:SDR family NAD(P)-dependent oxidoreductase [Micrococcales bacterium]
MKVAVITGASSGIGAATAKALANDGWQVVLGARRYEQVAQVAKSCGPTARAVQLDVTDQASVDALAQSLERVDLLVNNAGGAKGKRTIAEAQLEEWDWMYQTNVLGTVRLTRALLDKLVASGAGGIINVVSIAGYVTYAGGAGYNAAKFAQSALTQVLRQELIDQPVTVCELDPGLVETEFALVRFGGDQAKAKAVYEGITPLSAEDVAETIRWIAARPPHVNIDRLSILASEQLGAVKHPRPPR